MRKRVRHVSDVGRMAVHALQNGATVVRPGVVQWNIAGNCESPFPFAIEGRSHMAVGLDEWRDTRRVSVFANHAKPVLSNEYGADRVVWIDMEVRCRRCSTCLQSRSRQWAHRARAEIAAAPRTWFGTLTATPDDHFRMEARAAVRLDERGVSLWSISESERFREVSSEFGREITKWLKRIRKESQAPLRYILVAEAHKSGRPHYHMLLHEVSDARRVSWRTLNGQWALGFSQFKLVDAHAKTAYYVCKYLSKSAMARVRASLDYGKQYTLGVETLSRE